VAAFLASFFSERVECSDGCGSEVTPADGLILEEKPRCGLCAGMRAVEILCDADASPALVEEADHAMAILRAQIFHRRAVR
jgi:hypothetical protein